MVSRLLHFSAYKPALPAQGQPTVATLNSVLPDLPLSVLAGSIKLVPLTTAGVKFWGREAEWERPMAGTIGPNHTV